jgi:hypothetical protein
VVVQVVFVCFDHHLSKNEHMTIETDQTFQEVQHDAEPATNKSICSNHFSSKIERSFLHLPYLLAL